MQLFVCDLCIEAQPVVLMAQFVVGLLKLLFGLLGLQSSRTWQLACFGASYSACWHCACYNLLCGVTKHRTGFTNQTGRKLPHRRLKRLHWTQCQPSRTVSCFPTLILSYFFDRKWKFKRKVCVHNRRRINVYTTCLPQ